MAPYQIPDPHTVHVQVGANASEAEVEAAIQDALHSQFTNLSPPTTFEVIIHLKFGT